ncbi:MAG: hypothetical protein NZ521_09000, partial [Flammeovirgaceae bacterium]|nr:hypothetical protein [Flammeovirgaceae bacterium]
QDDAFYITTTGKKALYVSNQKNNNYGSTDIYQIEVPKKYRPDNVEYYVRAENPRGELGFFFRTVKNQEIPYRVKARGPSFVNLSVLPDIARGYLLADLIAIVGSIDFVMGEVDR